jgi:hypothetical protein
MLEKSLPTFETFLSSEQLSQIEEKAGITGYHDSNSALSDSLSERFEALYVAINNLIKTMVFKGGKGYVWIAGYPQMVNLFNRCGIFDNNLNYTSYIRPDGQMPTGLMDVKYYGLANRKWRIYERHEGSRNVILVGFNDKLESFEHYGKLIISNFI